MTKTEDHTCCWLLGSREYPGAYIIIIIIIMIMIIITTTFSESFRCRRTSREELTVRSPALYKPYILFLWVHTLTYVPIQTDTCEMVPRVH